MSVWLVARIVSRADGALEISVVRGMRGVGEVV